MPGRKKNKALAVVEQEPVKYELNRVGQYSFFPEVIEKARGTVIDSVIDSQLVGPVLIDDTYDLERERLPVQTRVMLSFDELASQAQASQRLNAFDREVIDAVASLYRENDVFSAKTIYRVITGKDRNYKVTPSQVTAVIKSLEKCGKTQIRIRIRDLAEKGSPIGRQLKKHGVIEAEYTGALIPYEAVGLKTETDSEYFIRLLKKPTFFAYAEVMGKVSTFPIGLLDTPISKTTRNIVLQSFLLRTIDSMYRREIRNIIPIDDIYAAINGQDDIPQHKARHRAAVETILNSWKTGEYKYILDFKKKTAGRYIIGYQIILNPSYDLPNYVPLPP